MRNGFMTYDKHILVLYLIFNCDPIAFHFVSPRAHFGKLTYRFSHVNETSIKSENFRNKHLNFFLKKKHMKILIYFIPALVLGQCTNPFTDSQPSIDILDDLCFGDAPPMFKSVLYQYHEKCDDAVFL